MVDNIKIYKEHILNFKNPGDFFYCMVLVRKKDFPENPTNHQSVRIIKDYCFYSIEDLDKRYEEIKTLAEVFKARVYLSVNRLNDSQVTIRMIKNLAERLESGDNNCRNLWSSTVGTLSSQEKRWVIDLDDDDDLYLSTIIDKINELEPLGNKIICQIPTKSGLHLITKPFRVDHFIEWKRMLRDTQNINLNLDIQKLNPSVLFLPNSLCND